jgi:putative transposase
MKLSDSQWQFIKKFIPNADRKRKHSLRDIIEGIYYLVRTGCQWRNLPVCYGPWDSVYYYFRRFRNEGIWEEIYDALHKLIRKKSGRQESPSLGTMDSQSVVLAPQMNEARGTDGNKRVNGRKRHYITDTLGLVMGIVIGSANETDSKWVVRVLETIAYKYPRLKVILADQAYDRTEVKEICEKYGWELQIGAKPKNKKGFVPAPIRWVVERSFAWTNFYRRLVKDYERTTESAIAINWLAFSAILLKRFTK